MKTKRPWKHLLLTALPALALACGDDASESACSPDDPSTCARGTVCEPVLGSEPACFAPVEIHGRVFDLLSGEAIAGARVMAEEASGRAVGDVAVTRADGSYSLRVPSTRVDREGRPVGQTLKMSAAARDFRPFPSGYRMALPVDTSAPGGADGAFVIQSPATEIALETLPEAQRGLPSLSGTVELPKGDRHEVLVAAESGGATVTGKADARGRFVLFNLAPGAHAVRAFHVGANHAPVEILMEGADREGIHLPLADVPTATLSGSVAVVSGNGATSVVLALESTFDEALARGVLVPGLRAPEPGRAPAITGDFTIAGIPDGDYVVLAAFENDGLVRDPDPTIAGTQIQRIAVRGGALDASPSFKVTSAVGMVGPGASGSLEEVPSPPTFRWRAYPSAKSYHLEVFDAYGTLVWENTVSQTEVTYAGEQALAPGLPHLWRVTAFGQAGNPISLTEDLLGVFRVAAE